MSSHSSPIKPSKSPMAISQSSPSDAASPRSPATPALSAKQSTRPSPPSSSPSDNTPAKSPTAQQALGSPKSGKIKLSPSEICEFETLLYDGGNRDCAYLLLVNGLAQIAHTDPLSQGLVLVAQILYCNT